MVRQIYGSAKFSQATLCQNIVLKILSASNYLIFLLKYNWHGKCLNSFKAGRRAINRGKEVNAMYAKFPFYSVAQMYATSLDEPVAILLGQDNLYWVVDQWKARDYMGEGCSLLSAAR